MIPSDLRTEYTCLLRCMRAAGDRALAMQDSTRSHLKSDGSPVSEADICVHNMLSEELQRHFPNDAILSEEAPDDLQRLRTSRVWIIDPIDGTAAYLNGGDDWAVQVALSIDNALTLGALYLPAHKRLYIGSVHNGVLLYQPDDSYAPCPLPENPQQCILLSRSTRNQAISTRIRALFPDYTMLPMSSVGAKVDAMLMGRACFHINPSPIHEWDYAAPAALFLAAGGRCCDQHNHTLSANNAHAYADGLIFSNTTQHAHMLARLRS